MGLKINGSTSGSIEIDVPAVAGTNTAITIPATTGGEFIVSDASGNVDLGPLDISGSAAADSVNIDASGRLLVGTSSTSARVNTLFQGTSGGVDVAEVLLARNEATPPDGNTLGDIQFSDSTHTDSASIKAQRDGGTWSASSKPTRLTFSTAADGASSPTERMRIRSTGVVGTSRGMVIGSLAGGTNDDALIISSSVIASGAGTNALKWNSNSGVVTYDTSSRLIKEEVIDCPYGIDEIKQLQPRKYFRIDDQREEIGFIADEMVDLMPEFVPVGPKSIITRNEEDTEKIPLGVNYDKLTAVLTKALQEAIAKIETLETANASQAATIAALDARLTALEGGAA